MSDNAARNAAGRRGCYEVWYVTWNDPRSGDGYWLRYVTEAPNADPARGELWFARFDPRRPERTFGIHGAFPAAVAHAAPFELHLGGAELADDRARGELAGNGHHVRWDLRWEQAPSTLPLLPDVMYARGGLGETTVLSPNPRVALSGTLEIDGETIELSGAIGGQTHLWGRKHAFAWAWAHCAELSGGDRSCGNMLELLAVRLQRGGVTLPPLTLVALELDGERHRLNQFRHTLGNRATWRTGHIAFRAWSADIRIAGELRCVPERMLVAPYIDPDGTDVHCANTEIGDAAITVWRRAGLRWREHAQLTSAGRAHFETGGRERPAEVTRDHVRV